MEVVMMLMLVEVGGGLWLARKTAAVAGTVLA
jgi:hypothetical protein